MLGRVIELIFFFQAEAGIRDSVASRGLGDVYKKQLRAPNTSRISGLTPIHDLEESLGVEIENDEVSTFRGLIPGELGRIPARGDTLSLAVMRITIDEVDERRVIAARVVYERSARN